jgi:phage gp36-like protein
MAWIALTSDAVQSQLSGRELELLTGGGLADGQPSPLADVLARAVAEVRSYIPALRPDPSLVEGCLPESLHGAVLELVRYRLATRLASGRQAAEWLLSEPRQRAYQDALAYLKDVARGLVAVEPPPTGNQPAQASGQFGSDPSFNP